MGLRSALCITCITAVNCLHAAADSIVIDGQTLSDVLIQVTDKFYYVQDPSDGSLKMVDKSSVALDDVKIDTDDAERERLTREWRSKRGMREQTSYQQEQELRTRPRIDLDATTPVASQESRSASSPPPREVDPESVTEQGRNFVRERNQRRSEDKRLERVERARRLIRERGTLVDTLRVDTGLSDADLAHLELFEVRETADVGKFAITLNGSDVVQNHSHRIPSHNPLSTSVIVDVTVTNTSESLLPLLKDYFFCIDNRGQKLVFKGIITDDIYEGMPVVFPSGTTIRGTFYASSRALKRQEFFPALFVARSSQNPREWAAFLIE